MTHLDLMLTFVVVFVMGAVFVEGIRLWYWGRKQALEYRTHRTVVRNPPRLGQQWISGSGLRRAEVILATEDVVRVCITTDVPAAPGLPMTTNRRTMHNRLWPTWLVDNDMRLDADGGA